MRHISRLLFLLTLILINAPAWAVWGTAEDADIEYEFFNRTISVNKEGETEDYYEYQLKILNANGVKKRSNFQYFYNHYAEHIEILGAKSILDEVEYEVPADMIENKPIASRQGGFDDQYKLFLAFTNVEKNTKLYINYKVTRKTPILPHYFDNQAYFFEPALWNQARIEVSSAIPFYYHLNNPHNHLHLEEYKDESIQKLILTIKKPFCEFIVDEERSLTPDSLKTFVEISTLKNFDQMQAAFTPDYEKVIDQPLTPLLEKIHLQAQSLENPIEQINYVTSSLVDKIRYLGDWKSHKGGYFPRSLETISKLQTADCKEFSTSTAAILRLLGYNVHVALVYRGIDYLMPSTPFATLGCVNHAILKVITPDNRLLWIDPTNTLSMADGIFSDIANRFAIVLDPQAPAFDMIPDIDPSHSSLQTSETLSFENNILYTQGTIDYKGESAYRTTMAIFSSPSVAKSKEWSFISGDKQLLKMEMDFPTEKTRIVHDLTLSYSYEAENDCIYSNGGRGYFLKKNWAQLFLNRIPRKPGDYLTTIPLFNPGHLLKTTLIKNIGVENISDLNYEIKTPWLNSKRSIEITENGVQITEDTSFLKALISAEEYQSLIYKQLMKDIEKYLIRMVMMFSEK